jgi:hypothetical protein
MTPKPMRAVTDAGPTVHLYASVIQTKSRCVVAIIATTPNHTAALTIPMRVQSTLFFRCSCKSHGLEYLPDYAMIFLLSRACKPALCRGGCRDLLLARINDTILGPIGLVPPMGERRQDAEPN